MKIPYEDLGRANAGMMDEMADAARRVIETGHYILGPEVESFEHNFAKVAEAGHCVGVANGMEALVLSVQALGLGNGAEVILAANSYIATVFAMIKAGLKPKYVEPDIASYNIDPDRIETAITSRTEAVCVTHLYGKPCRMDRIVEICRRHGLALIEDCAQAHGARFRGGMVGTFGDAGCYSFYPTKNLGACGDAGCVVTNDPLVAERVRILRNYGSRNKNEHVMLGTNSRLDEMQAAILSVKLKYLEEITKHKRRLAEVYFENLPEWVIKPRLDRDEYDVFHIFAARVEDRDRLRSFLEQRGVGTAIHYPVPPYRQPALMPQSDFDFPISDELHATELSLPISFGHEEREVMRVCEVMNEYEPS